MKAMRLFVQLSVYYLIIGLVIFVALKMFPWARDYLPVGGVEELINQPQQAGANGLTISSSRPMPGPFHSIAGPEREYVVDRLDKHFRTRQIHVAKHLCVGRQRTRADAEDEAPAEQVVKHGEVAGDRRRVLVGHVGGAGAETDVFGAVDQGGEKQGGRGDVLFRVSGVLADVALDEAQLIGELKGGAVFSERSTPVLADGMHGHGEKSEFHRGSWKIGSDQYGQY